MIDDPAAAACPFATEHPKTGRGVGRQPCLHRVRQRRPRNELNVRGKGQLCGQRHHVPGCLLTGNALLIFARVAVNSWRSNSTWSTSTPTDRLVHRRQGHGVICCRCSTVGQVHGQTLLGKPLHGISPLMCCPQNDTEGHDGRLIRRGPRWWVNASAWSSPPLRVAVGSALDPARTGPLTLVSCCSRTAGTAHSSAVRM